MMVSLLLWLTYLGIKTNQISELYLAVIHEFLHISIATACSAFLLTPSFKYCWSVWHKREERLRSSQGYHCYSHLWPNNSATSNIPFLAAMSMCVCHVSVSCFCSPCPHVCDMSEAVLYRLPASYHLFSFISTITVIVTTAVTARSQIFIVYYSNQNWDQNCYLLDTMLPINPWPWCLIIYEQ